MPSRSPSIWCSTVWYNRFLAAVALGDSEGVCLGKRKAGGSLPPAFRLPEQTEVLCSTTDGNLEGGNPVYLRFALGFHDLFIRQEAPRLR